MVSAFVYDIINSYFPNTNTRINREIELQEERKVIPDELGGDWYVRSNSTRENPTSHAA